jgi:hypothetical protein
MPCICMLKHEHTSKCRRQQDVIDDVHILRRKALVSMQQTNKSEGEMSRGRRYTPKLTTPRNVRPVLICAPGELPVVPGELPCKNGERSEGPGCHVDVKGLGSVAAINEGVVSTSQGGVLIAAVRQRDGSEEGRGRVCVSGQGGRRTDKCKGNVGISVLRTVQR